MSLGWELLSILPESELNRIDQELIDKYYYEAKERVENRSISEQNNSDKK